MVLQVAHLGCGVAAELHLADAVDALDRSRRSPAAATSSVWQRRCLPLGSQCRSNGQGSRHRKYASLPGISHHALAGVAGGDAGELALEGGRGGPAVQPFHFRGGGDEGSIVRLHSAIDDEGCARQRLERRTDNPVGVEVVRPSCAYPGG